MSVIMRRALSALPLRNGRSMTRLNNMSILTAPTQPRFHSAGLRSFSSKKDVESTTDEPKKGLFAKLKGVWKEYGYKAVVCYASLYFLNLGGIAVALETDVLCLHDFGFDAPAILDMVCGKYEELTGRKELGEIIHAHPRYGILAISLFLNDFFEPLRIGGTVLILSKLAKKNSSVE